MEFTSYRNLMEMVDFATYVVVNVKSELNDIWVGFWV